MPAGGSASVVVAGAAGTGVYEGVIPGRVFLQGALGLNGTDGVVPDVATGPVESGSFVSSARLGAHVRWHLLRPPGSTDGDDLPLVVALHGLGWEIDSFLPGDLGVAEFLASAVAGGTPRTRSWCLRAAAPTGTSGPTARTPARWSSTSCCG